MNTFLIFIIISVLLCLGICALIFRNRNIIFIAVMGAITFFSSYILGSMALFVIDRYTLFRAAAVTAALDIVVFAAALFFNLPKPFSIKKMLSFEFDLRTVLIPIVISILALPLAANKNELFGMGQDEGVYQCVAINLMNGLDDRQQDFEEYHLLGSDEARENFQWFVRNKLVGYDIPTEDYPDTVYDRSVSEVSGIYHGIPTYASVLAMWGELFGMKNMMGVESVFYVLTIFMVCFVCQNLKLKPLSETAAAVITAFSPIVIWVAKSALTEMFLAVLVTAFIFFLTDSDRPGTQTLSIIPVAVFSCYHVSIYTMVPFILIVYGGMYFFTRRKAFAVLMPVTIIGYLISYFLMRHVQPFYTMNNYRSIFVNGINVHNISIVVVVACVAMMAVSAVFIFFSAKTKGSFQYEAFMAKLRNVRILQILLIAMLLLPLLFIVYKSFGKFESFEEAGSLAIVGFAANAGILLLPSAVIIALIRPKIFLESPSRLVVFIAFFYCVLVYSAFLRFDIQYYYYYARYLAPFIPAAVIFAALALDRFGAKLLIPTAAVSLLFVAPYDHYLMRNVDDTRMEWDVVNDITDCVTQEDCVVIDRLNAPTLWLPVRAITGAHIYPLEADMDEQFLGLKEKYANVYFISSTPYTYNLESDLEIVYMNSVHCMEDKNSETKCWIPLPDTFTEENNQIYMYRSMTYQYVYDEAVIASHGLYGFDELESSFCWTNQEMAGVRCMLEKDDYELTVDLGCSIPLKEIGGERFEVKLYINGALVDSDDITPENNGKELVFTIPAECINNGSNVIGLETKLWSASIVADEDQRMLGIPLRSLVFASED